MLDDEFKVYLIECNTNPCLAVPCPLLSRIISKVLDNSFRLTLDPIYMPQDDKWLRMADIFSETKFELIFD